MSEAYWKRRDAVAEFEEYWNKENEENVRRRWSLIEELTKKTPHSSILDMGCGIGNLIAFTSLATEDNYLGIDISPPMVERARELHLGYHFTLADPMEFTTPSDLVVAHGFLLHQHDLFLKLHRLKELTRTCLIFDILVTKEGYSKRSSNGYWERVLGDEEYGFMKKELEEKFRLEEVKFIEWGDYREYFLKCERR